MISILMLIEDISSARRLISAATRELDAFGNRPHRLQRILHEVRGICMDDAGAASYLSRIESLLEDFSRLFPGSADVTLLRAPGRINLIGEHTDYNGLPVLPIAINRDIVIACSPRDDATVNLCSTREGFEPRRFERSARIDPYQPGDWGNYGKAAVQAIEEVLAEGSDSAPCGFDALIDGNIPMAGGLASSSALVVACGLATIAASGSGIDRHRLADLLARGEQYVGTRGGGMDQAVCLFAREGCALKIDFFPLRLEEVRLPADYNFVVCHSMVDAPKSAAARAAYNMRAAECGLAAAVLGATLASSRRVRKMEMRRLGDLYSLAPPLSEADIDSLIEESFRENLTSVDDLLSRLGMNEAELHRTFFDFLRFDEFRSLEGLKLRNRCRHVLSEGRRVGKAVEAIREGRFSDFGSLMYESHNSCAADYEISIPELDALVDVAREAGAYGSRLTGAGFGGCTISLVRDGDIDRFIEHVERSYYSDYLDGSEMPSSGHYRRSESIFACRPVQGAGSLFS